MEKGEGGLTHRWIETSQSVRVSSLSVPEKPQTCSKVAPSPSLHSAVPPRTTVSTEADFVGFLLPFREDNPLLRGGPFHLISTQTTRGASPPPVPPGAAVKRPSILLTSIFTRYLLLFPSDAAPAHGDHLIVFFFPTPQTSPLSVAGKKQLALALSLLLLPAAPILGECSNSSVFNPLVVLPLRLRRGPPRREKEEVALKVRDLQERRSRDSSSFSGQLSREAILINKFLKK